MKFPATISKVLSARLLKEVTPIAMRMEISVFMDNKDLLAQSKIRSHSSVKHAPEKTMNMMTKDNFTVLLSVVAIAISL